MFVHSGGSTYPSLLLVFADFGDTLREGIAETGLATLFWSGLADALSLLGVGSFVDVEGTSVRCEGLEGALELLSSFS